MKKRKRKLC